RVHAECQLLAPPRREALGVLGGLAIGPATLHRTARLAGRRKTAQRVFGVPTRLARAVALRYGARPEEDTVSQLTTDDRVAIAEIMAAYCHAIDRGQWDVLPGLFTEDCRLDFGSLMGVFEGHDGVRRFADTLKGIGLLMRHYTTNLVLRGD